MSAVNTQHAPFETCFGAIVQIVNRITCHDKVTDMAAGEICLFAITPV